MSKKEKKNVRFIKPLNFLKQKVGSGGIDEALLEKGQEAIEKTTVDFMPFAEQYLKEFSQYARQCEKINDNIEFMQIKEKMVRPVMQLKAGGGMFKYHLLSDVADIALQFMETVDTPNPDTIDVIRAHENTLKVIVANNLKGNGGHEGFALIKELDAACNRYFTKYQKDDD